MEKSIALEEETIKQKKNMSKKYSQTVAATSAWRASCTVMLPISPASSTRMAPWTAAIAVLTSTVTWVWMAQSTVASSLDPGIL